MRKLYLFLLFLTATTGLSAQQLYYKQIPVYSGSDTLIFGGAGGLNTPQFSEIDLNNDGIKDLLVFDRSAQIALTFLNSGTAGQVSYTFAPDYMRAFPQKVRNFMLARDYNCDGIEDLFYFNQPIFTSGGIAVMKGSYDADNKIKFTPVSEILKYNSQFGLGDIFIFNPDVPGLEDMDGDGDLDVAAFTLDFTFNRSVYFYKNLSDENGFGCDSLQFNLEHECFGLASETTLNNNTFFLSPGVDSCADNPYWNQRPAGGPRHSGSSVTLIDWNIDGAMDMIIGDVSINSLNLLTSEIVSDTLLFIDQDATFPSYNSPVDIFSFPSSYFVDVNNDGQKDMIAAVTELSLSGAVTDSVAWLYENVGDDTIWLDFRQKDFMVGEMIDLGRGSNAAVVDVNGDGLLDIISGNFGYTDAQQTYTTSLAYFENTGSSSEPAFTLINRDFGGLSSLNERALYPNFGDIDNDGDQDMIVGCLNGSLKLYINTAGAGNLMAWTAPLLNYKGINEGNFSAPQFVDIDRDGDLDLMVGTYLGQLNFFENIGNSTVAGFLPTPTSNTFGFDLNSIGSGYATPHFYDNNGAFELFLGHELGGIIHLGNIDGNITGIYDTLSLEYGDIYTGKLSTVAIADFDRDDTLDFVVGNIRGGLSFYSSETIDSTVVSTFPATSSETALLYPNPSKGTINIRLTKASQTANFTVFDALGRVVFTSEFNNSESDYQLNLKQLSAGMYFLKIETDFGGEVKRIRVQ